MRRIEYKGKDKMVTYWLLGEEKKSGEMSCAMKLEILIKWKGRKLLNFL